jgi:hypothetical protein
LAKAERSSVRWVRLPEAVKTSECTKAHIEHLYAHQAGNPELLVHVHAFIEEGQQGIVGILGVSDDRTR